MTLRISQYAVMCGLGLLALPGVVQGQAPRYQRPAECAGTATAAEAAHTHTDYAERYGGGRCDRPCNDQIISRSDLERSVSQLEQENQQSGANPTEVAEREKNLLRDMIDQQLLLSRAKELGLNVDADVIRRLDDIRKSNHMDTLEDLEKAARSQGVSYEDFKAQIRNSC